MNIREIHKGLVTYRFPQIIAVIAFILFRFSDEHDYYSISLWASTLLQIGIAFFLLFLTQAFGIIRRKSLLPAFFYLLLTGTNPVVFDSLQGSISAIVVLLCLLYIFLGYQLPESQRYALNISLLLTAGSFVWQPILLFLPLFWYGMYRFRSLNWQTFFASFMGFAVIYLFIFTYAVYRDNLQLFVDELPDFRIFEPLQLPNLSIIEWIRAGFIFFLFVLSGVKIFMAGVSEKIQAITTLGYLYTFLLVIFSCYFLFPQWEQIWLLIMYMPLALLFAHYFTLAQKNWTLWLLLLSIVFFLILYIII